MPVKRLVVLSPDAPLVRSANSCAAKTKPFVVAPILGRLTIFVANAVFQLLRLPRPLRPRRLRRWRKLPHLRRLLLRLG